MAIALTGVTPGRVPPLTPVLPVDDDEYAIGSGFEVRNAECGVNSTAG